MTKPYLIDLRDRALARVLNCESVRSVAATLSIRAERGVKVYYVLVWPCRGAQLKKRFPAEQLRPGIAPLAEALNHPRQRACINRAVDRHPHATR
jgi:hypothetical protein